MAFQPAICVNCGGALQVDDTDLNGFCECKFCHTSHKVIEVITIDGLPTVKTLLMNAEMSIDDGNPEKAVKTFQEVLRIKPNCHEAWWGLYLCNSYFDRYYGYQDKYGNSGEKTKAAIMLQTLEKDAMRAIEYAPPKQKEQYEAQIQGELNYIEQVRSGISQSGDGPSRSGNGGGSSGCYIATAVYGSYTCDEVFALRRYRDDYLARRAWGRGFIRVYYALSPKLAAHIPQDSALAGFIRKYLDRKVEKLSASLRTVD